MARLIKVGEYQNDSERWAAEFLKERLPDDYSIFVSVDVFDDYGFRLDCDQIIIGEHAVYVVEVKGYSGNIIAEKDDWQLAGGKIVRSPVSLTTTKAKTLASRIRERVFGRRNDTPWCQPVVFVTGGRGENVHIDLQEARDAVFDPGKVVEALTSPDQLNNRYKKPLTSDQRALAQTVITNLRLLRQRPTRVGSFNNIRELGRAGSLKVCTGTLNVGELERKFLLRIAEGYSYDHRDLWRADCQSLTDEARLYHELGSIPGIPYAAPLIEEDESVTFAIAYPGGKPVSSLRVRDLALGFRRDVLESVAETLNAIHQRGMAHGGLTPDWIYVTDGVTVEVLNLSTEQDRENAWAAPEARGRKSPDQAGDVYSLARIFAPWFGRIVEDGRFLRDERLDSAHDPILDWITAALLPVPADRPRVNDLVRILRRMEMGIVPVSGASEEPFEREPGAVLHDTYRLEDLIGTGPAGEVWRARHNRGNYPLALYFADQRNEQFLRARFEEIAGLHHPMIVRAYDMRRVPGRDSLYMAAEWLNGRPVDEMLEIDKLPDQTTVLGWFRDLLIALEFVHDQEVLHRNISPDAIVIVDGRPRLVEFSLLPDKERRAGLIEYSDPRVSEAGWSRESDLYALAATFLNLLAGITPRTVRGTVLDTAQIERALPSALPTKVRQGLLEVLAPGFELQTDRYVELFGIHELPKAFDKLPAGFLKQWGLSLTGHQERVARFMIQEFHGKRGRARSRSAVVKGSLKLTDVRANRTLRNSANAAIPALISKGVLYNPPGTRAVRPTEKFLRSWSAFITDDPN